MGTGPTKNFKNKISSYIFQLIVYIQPVRVIKTVWAV